MELIKRAGDDPFPSQTKDDPQNPPIIDDLEEPEYEVEAILRARTMRRGRGRYLQALVKWTGWADPSWEPVEYVQDTMALQKFEELYGPIDTNDGPNDTMSGAYVGPPENKTLESRRQRRRAK